MKYLRILSIKLLKNIQREKYKLSKYIMKNLKIIVSVIIIILIGVFIWSKDINKNNPLEEISSIKGCYIAGNTKDIYTLNIESIDGENIAGTLSFKNFEKDSSKGSFKATYKDNILLGEYTFASEGTESIMQVIFKKSGDDFIRGYGEVNQNGDHFLDINNITYDNSPLSIFKKAICPNSQ